MASEQPLMKWNVRTNENRFAGDAESSPAAPAFVDSVAQPVRALRSGYQLIQGRAFAAARA